MSSLRVTDQQHSESYEALLVPYRNQCKLDRSQEFVTRDPMDYHHLWKKIFLITNNKINSPNARVGGLS
jgi:hypothetical protein